MQIIGVGGDDDCGKNDQTLTPATGLCLPWAG